MLTHNTSIHYNREAVEFRELSDCEWKLIKLLLPKTRIGKPRIDDRMAINGILYVLVTDRRCLDRFKRWSARGHGLMSLKPYLIKVILWIR
ncbi:transposase [Candidatus Bathyarchaeota archaeon]|nr:transposase [Candidatus Bathyarchaeota archaeon]